MRIKRHGLQVFSAHNAGYNGAAAPIVGDIFDTELRQPEQYVVSRPVQPRRPARLESKSESGDYVVVAYVPPKHQVGRFDTTGLGEYERVLLSCLAWGKYSTYVLVGEMGSGKTTTARFIEGVLQRPRAALCGNCAVTVCEPLILYIDFNSLIPGPIVRRFRTKLRASFKSQLRYIFRTAPLLLTEFVAFVREAATEPRTATLTTSSRIL